MTAIKDKDDNCKIYQSVVDAETTFQRQNATVLQWVSPTDPMLMHEGIVARTKTKTKYTESGEWLLTSTEFVDWDNENGKYQVIWLFGTGLSLSLELHDSSAVNWLNSRHGKDNTDVGVRHRAVFVLVLIHSTGAKLSSGICHGRPFTAKAHSPSTIVLTLLGKGVVTA
jgi:hypothetical protein